MTQFRLIVRLF